MMGQTIAIIQARMSSSRLPGKVMLPLAGRPMIWHIVQRAMACEYVDVVMVATSSESSDDSLAELCREYGIQCYRGDLHTVLSRYIEVLDENPSEYVVRITGDCPLIDPRFIDQQILVLRQYEADLVWLADPVSVLEGQGVHSASSLRNISERTNHPDDLEHVGSRYLSEHPHEFRIVGMRPPRRLSNLRWRITIDELPDYHMIQTLYEALWDGELIPLEVALNWLAQNSLLSNVNDVVRTSVINQKIHAKISGWEPHVDFFAEW